MFQGSEDSCVITGAGLQIPGVGAALDLLAESPSHDAPFEPKMILGRKGLFGKDRATLLALCAAKLALAHAKWPESGIDAARIGVVVSSNFGNLDTVERVLQTVSQGGSATASMMDAPNASSNVISSTLAIRFGCKGPNYTICSGGTASIDALRVARLTLDAGRADAMIVVGVETRNPVVEGLVAPHLRARSTTPGRERLAEGAAALIIERASSASARGVPGLFRIGAPRRFRTESGAAHLVIDGALRAIFTTSCAVGFARKSTDNSVSPNARHVIDIEDRLGTCHGLLAIVQAVLACALLRTCEAGASLHALLHAGAPYEAEWATAVLEPLPQRC